LRFSVAERMSVSPACIESWSVRNSRPATSRRSDLKRTSWRSRWRKSEISVYFPLTTTTSGSAEYPSGISTRGAGRTDARSIELAVASPRRSSRIPGMSSRLGIALANRYRSEARNGSGRAPTPSAAVSCVRAFSISTVTASFFDLCGETTIR
jgi:hypothetical protein